jgi:PIN domain nuclease of toxin-antitoxin system
LQLPCDPADWFTEALQPAGIELLPVTSSIACSAVALSDIHRDPFDRLIIATALEHGARFASVDGQFGRYPELSNVLMEP